VFEQIYIDAMKYDNTDTTSGWGVFGLKKWNTKI